MIQSSYRSIVLLRIQIQSADSISLSMSVSSPPAAPDSDTPDHRPPAPPPSDSSRPNEDPRWRSVSAFFRPIVGTQEEYERLFQEACFGDWTDLNLRQAYGFIRFSSLARVDLFVERFNGHPFNGSQMSAARSRPPTTGGKTLHLSSLDPHHTTERTLYNEFSPYGFIRRIALKGSYAFIEFDTVEDAERALNIFTGERESTLDGYRVGITYARNEHRVDNVQLSLKLSDVLPETHKFWKQLQKMSIDR
jgi:hypothetical protein